MKVPQPRSKNRAPQQAAWRFGPQSWLLLLVGALLAVGLHTLGMPLFKKAPRGLPAVPAASSAPSTNRWGDLEITSIWLERPAEFFAYDAPPPASNFWFFGRYSPQQLTDLLAACALPPEPLGKLLNTNAWRVFPEGIWVHVESEIIRDLPAAARAKLYGTLSEFPQNPGLNYPFMTKSTFREWFDQSELSADTLRLVEGMTYRNNGLLCFADRQILHQFIPQDETLKVSRTLARVPSLLVQLRITPDSNVDQLMHYWGMPSRRQQVRPLLESVKRLPQGSSLNIAWFFPPVPRLLLYSYPHPTNVVAGKWPDCFWSSYNFRLNTADDRFTSVDYQGRIMQSEYRPVPKPDLFGDLILLYEPLGADLKTVHMCVYIADDIVFTKNGYAPREPWVLMRLEDMMIHYSPKKPLSRLVLRHKTRL